MLINMKLAAKIFRKILPTLVSLFLAFNIFLVSGFSLPTEASDDLPKELSVHEDMAVTEATTAVPTTGVKKVAVFYATFLDDKSRSMSWNQLSDYFNNDLNARLALYSNNKISVQANVYFLDMIMNKKCDSINTLAVEARRAAADQLFIDTNNFDVNAIIFDNNCPDAEFDGMAQRGTPRGFFYSTGLGPVMHEFGHMLGLRHANYMECGDVTIHSSCGHAPEEYGDFTDLMGKDAYYPNDFGPYAKDIFGWYNSGELRTISRTQGGVYRLHKFDDYSTNSQKVIKIPTFNGGPVYYLAYNKAFMPERPGIEGPFLYLASSATNVPHQTWLLDMSPNSKTGDEAIDFEDGYLRVGQTWQDPFNGISLRGVSRVGSDSFDVEVAFQAPTGGTSTITVNWSRPDSLLKVTGQQQTVGPWQPVHYIFDMKCTTQVLCDDQWNTWENCGDWPKGTCPPYDTTDHFTDVKLAAGLDYRYRVYILTKKDGDPNNVATYHWWEENVNNTCGSGTCTVRVSWPKVTYKVNLLRDSDGQGVCSSLGCSDFTVVQETSAVTFKGLPKETNVHAKVSISDFGGGTHLLHTINGLGTTDEYYKSCTGGTGCSFAPLSFLGSENISYYVKLKNESGIYVDDTTSNSVAGPNNAFADFSGGFSRSWNYDYIVVAFPSGFGNCLAAGDYCRINHIYNNSLNNLSFRVGGLLSNEQYSVYICVFTCNPPQGQNSYAVNPFTLNSSVSGMMSFFSNDPLIAADAFEDSNIWKGEYFNNDDMTGLVFERPDEKINFNWSSDSPGTGIDPDTFSVRWTGSFDFEDKVYRFATAKQTDDGVRLYIDGEKVIDNWDGTPTSVQYAKKMGAGLHTIVVEYKEGTGSAFIRANWVDAYACYDIDGNGKITSADLGLVAAHLGTRGVSAWDVNGDGAVTAADLGLTANKINQSCQ